MCSLPLCCILSCFLVSSCCPVRVRWRWVEIDLELMKPTVLFGRFGVVRVSPACWQTDCPVTNLIKQGLTVTQCSQRPPSAQAADGSKHHCRNQIHYPPSVTEQTAASVTGPQDHRWRFCLAAHTHTLTLKALQGKYYECITPAVLEQLIQTVVWVCTQFRGNTAVLCT